jgi:DMSO reductase anchor subunit
MNPAWSVIVFTTVSGAAQGLAVMLALAQLSGAGAAPGLLGFALPLVLVMLGVALTASTLHLGRPARAWRAVMMWRTSWLSREVIVLPAFIAAVALWSWTGKAAATWLLLLVLVLSVMLWLCTAMIYACLRFIQEWAHPLTLLNYLLIGLASGAVLACALAAAFDDLRLLSALGPVALFLTAAAAAARGLSLRRNAALVPRSTLQSATGIRSHKLTQVSMGMTGGSFNTREFFHGCTLALLGGVKLGFVLMAFVLPLLMLLYALRGGPRWTFIAAALVQAPGLLAERWFFFAQARHPQNLYYQVVS